MKQAGQKIAMLTAYDYPTARVLNEADIDVILVGDSLGMVALGFEDTRRVTISDMLRHTGAVARGNAECLLVADLPYGTYETPADAVENARLLRDAGAEAVKPEGNKPASVEAIIADGIPVMGHAGLLPQTSETFRVHGRKSGEAARIMDDAKALEEVGCFAIVLEGIPAQLAEEITTALEIPTIGIGAGGGVRWSSARYSRYDRAFSIGFSPTFVKQYADLGGDIKRAVTRYKQEVKTGTISRQRAYVPLEREENVQNRYCRR